MEPCASRPVLGFRTGGRTHNHILALGNVLPLAEKRSGQFSLHIPAVLEAPLRLPNPASSMDHVARYIAEARARPMT